MRLNKESISSFIRAKNAEKIKELHENEDGIMAFVNQSINDILNNQEALAKYFKDNKDDLKDDKKVQEVLVKELTKQYLTD